MITIYNLALADSSVVDPDVYHGGRFRGKAGHDQHNDKPFNACPQLLRVCRSIYFKAQPLLISQSTFSVHTIDMKHQILAHDDKAMFPFIRHLIIRVSDYTETKELEILTCLLDIPSKIQPCTLEMDGSCDHYRSVQHTRSLLRCVRKKAIDPRLLVKHVAIKRNFGQDGSLFGLDG
jgi:hypothetical protein